MYRNVCPLVLYVILMSHSIYRVQALATVSTVSVNQAPWPSDSMAHIASQLLEFNADPNARDCDGCSPLHRAIQCGNAEVFNVLLSNDRL